ncbi:MAG: hypothetical protein NVS3B26_19130 [Mycobacteriales bacterium]
MSPDARAELRALALWHTRRRAVDELLTPLLEYGPAAVDRVADHLTVLRSMMADEMAAFEAFADVLPPGRRTGGVVLPMFGRGQAPPAAL